MKIFAANGKTLSPDISDPTVFTVWFRQYYAPLCLFAERILGDRDNAEDIVEDTFFKLWNRQAHFENEEHLKAFLYRAVKNACLDFIKTNERSERRNTLFTEDQQAQDEGYLHEIIRIEVIRELYAAIDSLPPQSGKIIKMSFVEGKTNQEIADELNLSVQTVKNQKGRGLGILKDRLPSDKFQLLLLIPFLEFFELFHKN